MGSSDTNASDISLVFHMQDFFLSPFHSESETTLEKCLFSLQMEILHLCQLHFHLKENQKSLFSKEAYTLDSYNQC